MTINYTTLLGLAQPVTGTEQGTWGTVVNDEITALIEEAIAGGETINVTSGNVTLTDTDGVANQARNAILLITGTPGTTRNVVAPSTSKVYIVRNGSDGAIVLKGSATTGVTIPAGGDALCFWNGSDFEIGTTFTTILDVDNLRLDGNTISSTDTNGNIVLAPNGTGDVQVDADTLRVGDSNANATITTNGTGDLILNTNAGTNSGSITIEDAANGNIIIAPNGTGDVYVDADTLRVGDSGSDATIQSNGNADLILKTGNATTGSVTLADGANGSLTVALNGTGQVIVNAGAVGTPTIAPTGDTNTGIFFPAADTIAFAEGGVEAARLDSSGNFGLGVTPSAWDSAIYKAFQVSGGGAVSGSTGQFNLSQNWVGESGADKYIATAPASAYAQSLGEHKWYNAPSGTAGNTITFTERMRIDSSGNVLIGTTIAASRGTLNVPAMTNSYNGLTVTYDNTASALGCYQTGTTYSYGAAGASESWIYSSTRNLTIMADGASSVIKFASGGNTERARITSDGNLCVGKTTTDTGTAGAVMEASGTITATRAELLFIANRLTTDGTLFLFRQANADEGSISVSGNTVSYNAFSGGHWSQLQEGRGYNPDIPRGTVMSTIGEMCLWKSVEWTETTEHPAIPAVEAKEAVLDDEGNVIEPAVEAVEGKDAWTETSEKRENYFGDLPVGATFEEDGFTKTVVDDGNERLPKVKISDVVGDKAVYGVFQTWDEVQDMLVTSLGAFVVRIAAGVTVEIGDLLESNGDGCAKVQDDDVIRSKTIAKVTSTTPTATYDDGSYTVPAVIYCG